LRWLVLSALHLGTRLPALTLLPIFLDETLHVRWALLIWEGKKPWWRPWEWGRALTVWLGALVTPFATDPLWAHRCLSVAFGLLTLITTVAISRWQAQSSVTCVLSTNRQTKISGARRSFLASHVPP